MSGFYVTGGRQRNGAAGENEWFSYEEASIVRVDAETHEVTECCRYSTPDEIRPDDPRANIVFKAGSLDNGDLLVCTQTEILRYSLPEFKQIGYLTHPWLNDVHHVVRLEDGRILVANTGLDQILEMSVEGEVLGEWPAIPGLDTWGRFDRERDYRRVITTKPHQCHPNYIFQYKGEIWVSRFVQKDLLCLSDPSKTIDIGVEKIHDGNVLENIVYCTSVDGHVVLADLEKLEIVQVHDLGSYSDNSHQLGWCRGLHILDKGRVMVGFSRLRPSRFKENLRWVRYSVGLREDKGYAPTRVVIYDLEKGKMESEINLEKVGLNAVFSILPA
jgi:hypothetical protein